MTSVPNDLGKSNKMLSSRKSLQKNSKPRRSYRNIPEVFQFLLNGSPHPLLIPCIVGEVAAYLPLSDLKGFRQVCSQWNDETCKQLRRKAKIVLQGEDDVAAYTKLNGDIGNYHTNFELRGDLDLGSSVVQKFFQLFGVNMKYVYFNRVKWKESELKVLLFEKLPNLEELCLETRAYSDRRLFPGNSESHESVLNVEMGASQRKPAFPESVTDSSLVLPKIRVLRLNIFSLKSEVTAPFLRDVLRASPNVEVISSLKTSSISNPLPMPFIQYVCQAMNYDTADDLVHMPYAADIAIADAIVETNKLNLSKLACIDCNMRLRTHGLNQLALKGYPLRQLDLTVMSDVTSFTLQKLLGSVHNTLQVLKLKFQPGCPAAEEFITPEMGKLKTLTLNGFKSSFKFLEKLPSLRSLTFIRINLQRALGMEAIQCRSGLQIQRFQVFEEFSMEALAEDTIRLLAILFPCVKWLKLENLCDESLTQVFMGFPLLEELDALNGFYTDNGVTGVRNSALNSTETSLEIVDILQLKDKPGIAYLKNLRSLSLGSPKISDRALIYGVILCKNLRRLHLMSYGITDVGLLRLNNELDLFYLKTEYCFQLTKAAVFKVKEQMKGRQLYLNEYTGPMKQSEIPKFMRRNWNVSVRLNKLEVNCPQISNLSVVPPKTNDDDKQS